MGNRNKVMQKRLVPPLACVAVVAVFLTTSGVIAPHVGNQNFGDFWLGALSLTTLIGAIVAAIAALVFAGASIDDWLDE